MAQQNCAPGCPQPGAYVWAMWSAMPVLEKKSMLPSERFLGCGVKGEISIMLSYADGVNESASSKHSVLWLPVLLSPPGKAKPVPWRQC